VSVQRSALSALERGRHDLLSVVGEDIGHVLVEPFQLVAHREAKVLELLCDQVIGLVALFENPAGGADGRHLAASCHC
jgi:hypothetical protein